MLACACSGEELREQVHSVANSGMSPPPNLFQGTPEPGVRLGFKPLMDD
jgi:hypothetical protein